MSNNLFDLSDEVAVVIGATGVLGGSMASALHPPGPQWLWLDAMRSVAHSGRLKSRKSAVALFSSSAMLPIEKAWRIFSQQPQAAWERLPFL
jgi:NAD(P)-dependent dehydrogenase (short-subunit alcohol dehydrogenase family)